MVALLTEPVRQARAGARATTECYTLSVTSTNWVQGARISRDPIGEKGGMNLYEFSRNNCFMWVDILGLGTWNISLPNVGNPGGASERPVIAASYTMDADEMKCCKAFKIKRKARGGLKWSDDDDPDSRESYNDTANSTGDQPGGWYGLGPQIIPLTYHFTWTAVCTQGPQSGQILSETSREYKLFWYKGKLYEQPPSPTSP